MYVHNWALNTLQTMKRLIYNQFKIIFQVQSGRSKRYLKLRVGRGGGEAGQCLLPIWREGLICLDMIDVYMFYFKMLDVLYFFSIDREEDGLFGDDEEEEAQLGVPKQFYYDEYDDPYDIF